MARGRSDGTVRATVDQGLAELVPDPDTAGAWTLLIDGTPQSHVDVEDPTRLHFDYVRLVGHVLDAIGEPARPLNVLHLGGGAWTLARYVAATRPGSRQRIVEVDAALISFVRDHLPAPGVRVRAGDALAVLRDLGDATVDVVVVDVFAEARTPEHLMTTELVEHSGRVLRPGGVHVANVTHDPRAQVAGLTDVFVETAVLGDPQVLKGRVGNLILVGSRQALPLADLARRLARDARPARLLQGAEVTAYRAGARPLR